MVIKVKLKNTGKYVLLDHEVYETLTNLPIFKEYGIFENLREHSSGVPVFQKYIDTVDGKLKVESIYLALYIAKRYIPKPESSKRMFLQFQNSDKLDLRLKNMKWEEMSKLSRNRTTVHNKTGFRGVRKTPQGKFVAMISDGTKQIYLGTFESAEDAALAYNGKSLELFGQTGNLNKVDENGRPVPHRGIEEKKKKTRKRTKEKIVNTKTVKVEKISLLPAQYEIPKKRGRKPKNQTINMAVHSNGSDNTSNGKASPYPSPEGIPLHGSHEEESLVKVSADGSSLDE